MKTWAWPVLKIVLSIAIIAAVGRQFVNDLRRPELAELEFRWPWLVFSGGLYLLGLTCPAWFWHRLLRSTGNQPHFFWTCRAYFIGQLGKYVPGKAWALLLRGGLVAGPEVNMGTAILTAFYETLTMMATGALLASVIFALQSSPSEILDLPPVYWSLLMLALLGTLILPGVFNLLLGGIAKKFANIDFLKMRPMRIRDLLEGLFIMSLGWCLMGLSLWAALAAVMPSVPELTPLTWIHFIAIIALSYVIGFAALVIPSGIGVREVFLLTLLGFAGPEGLVALAVLLMRLTWTVAELLAALGLELAARVLRGVGPSEKASRISRLAFAGFSRTLNGKFRRPIFHMLKLNRRKNIEPNRTMISIVIPLCNERDSLAVLHEEIVRTAQQHNLQYEIVFVDDGSNDGSWDIIADLSRRFPQVHGIRFRRNFGKSAALSAGFSAARGDTVLTLDADLQDDPAETPRFLQAIAEGKEVVSGWKKIRHDPWHKVLPSRVFNFMVSWSFGVPLHDHNCGMKCFRAEVLREIRLYGELHRFIPVLAAARGFTVGEVVIQHRPRRFGSSKYGVRRFVKGFLDLLTVKFLTGFGQRPQHLLGSIGLLSFLAGNLGLLYLAVIWIVRLWRPDDFLPLHDRPLLTYAAAALLLGAQMMSMGFLAELITAYLGRDQESYSVRERTGVQDVFPPLPRYSGGEGRGEGDRAPREN